jgi:hypothetical protein
MVILVLGNVVLRYGFNLGITVSEEISRWLFVWLTFLGATLAMRDWEWTRWSSGCQHRGRGQRRGRGYFCRIGVWLSDITYVWTQEGWLYLCCILDLFNREIAGWSMQPRLRQACRSWHFSNCKLVPEGRHRGPVPDVVIGIVWSPFLFRQFTSCRAAAEVCA